jgi:hypothetical protein
MDKENSLIAILTAIQCGRERSYDSLRKGDHAQGGDGDVSDQQFLYMHKQQIN